MAPSFPNNPNADTSNGNTNEPGHSTLTSTSTSTSSTWLQARPSQRLLGTQLQIEADGDTWQETLAVCEAPPPPSPSRKENKSKRGKQGGGTKKENHDDDTSTGRLLIRSYFQNTRNGRRVWDEPPSGASQILPATEEMRRMAQIQLAELQLVTGNVQDTTTTTNPTTNDDTVGVAVDTMGKDGTPTKHKQRRGFFGFGKFNGNSNGNHNDNHNSNENHRIRYKPGSSLLVRNKQGAPPTTTKKTGTDHQDAQLQEAIARSLAESQGIPYHTTATTTTMRPDDEQLAMAKALSLSAAAAAQQQRDSSHQETEEQILARVLEQSKIEDAIHRGTMQAALSEPEANTTNTNTHDLLGMTMTIPNEDDDRKLPAYSATTAATSTVHNYPAPTSPIPTYATAPGAARSTPQPQNQQLRGSQYQYSLPTTINATSTTNAAALASSPSSSKSPVSPMFDPYSKDAPSAASRVLKEQEGQDSIKAAATATKKKHPSSAASARLGFGKRASSKKIQEQAGLV